MSSARTGSTSSSVLTMRKPHYVVLVDDVIITDPPLTAPPRLEDIVRIYATSQGQA